jgi:rSAM/selenodomain-associated transferase 2
MQGPRSEEAAQAGGVPQLAVIVPVLNEARALPRLLAQLREQRGIALECIVADGGSRDESAALARAAGARVLEAPRGRAAQMNAAAAHARAPELLFLHADCALEDPGLLRDALAALREARARHGPRVAGHFALRFERGLPGRAHLFRHMEAKTRLGRPGTINGDQGFWLSAEYFGELGGFDVRLPFLEDQRLAERVFATGHWTLLPGRLHTAARRFETQGHYRLYTLMAIVMGMHAAGVDGFFARAPQVYAAQSEAGGLRLGPYLRLVRELLLEAGLQGAPGIVWRVGRYVRSQAWQPFFALDVWLQPWLGPDRSPLLALHDRVLRPLIHHRLGDFIASVAVSTWFLIVLPLACAWLERPSRTRAASS